MTTLPLRSRHIPWLFVAGFTLVVAVNATMIWLAVGSFSGLYTAKPRDRGLHYNTVVEAQKSRDALGWRIDAQWRPDSNRLEVAAFHAAGQPLAGARILVELMRPVEKLRPLAVAMGDIDGGRFAGLVELPARGNWDVDIVVEHHGERYALTRRMFLR
jgi:nitrogen fixation protein FixH